MEKTTPEANGEYVAESEDTLAENPEVDDIAVSNSIELPTATRSPFKRDEVESDIVSESPDVNDTAASLSKRLDYALVFAHGLFLPSPLGSELYTRSFEVWS